MAQGTVAEAAEVAVVVVAAVAEVAVEAEVAEAEVAEAEVAEAEVAVEAEEIPEAGRHSASAQQAWGLAMLLLIHRQRSPLPWFQQGLRRS